VVPMACAAGTGTLWVPSGFETWRMRTLPASLLLAASVFLVAWGVGAIIRKRWRGALGLLLGLGLFATYIVLLGAAAYLLGATDKEGAAVEPQHKARILGESISYLMNTTVLGAPLGVLAAVIVLVRGRRASRRAHNSGST
jgi:hypothetical protein